MKTFFISIAIMLAAFQTKAAMYVRQTNTKSETDSLIEVPAPAFRLRALDGSFVSLSDYSGKILVLDFWATWCAPCRASFPAMKKLVEKYEADTNVRFLFIDTKERTKDYTKKVRAFLTKNNYPFKVAFDATDNAGNMDVVFKQYDIPGIPVKFIIDGKGMIRSKKLGYDTKLTDDQHVKEIDQLITAIKQER